MLSKRVAKALETERVLTDGEYVFREGDTGNEMFVISSGSVVITKTIDGAEQTLASFGRGEFFGEMALLESLPREADARAVGQTKVLVFGPGALLLRLRRDPSFALEMLRKLSGRIRVMNAQLGMGARADLT